MIIDELLFFFGTRGLGPYFLLLSGFHTLKRRPPQATRQHVHASEPRPRPFASMDQQAARGGERERGHMKGTVKDERHGRTGVHGLLGPLGREIC